MSRSFVRWLLPGLAGFLFVVVMRLPASWISGRLPPQLQCQSPGGTVWRGSCQGLAIAQGVAGRPPLLIEQLQWRLQPLSLLRGRARADITLRRGAGQASASVSQGIGGSLEVQHLNGSLPVDRALLPALPEGWRAEAAFSNLDFLLQGSTLQRLHGTAQLLNVSDASGVALGSYELDFGKIAQPPPFTGQLRSLDGQLIVNGSLRLEANTAWQMSGTIAPRPGSPASLARMLSVLGPVDATGAYAFSISAEP